MRGGVIVTRGANPAVAGGAPYPSWVEAALRGVVVTLWCGSGAGSVVARALRLLWGEVGRALAPLARRSPGHGAGGGELFVLAPSRLLRVGEARVLRSGRGA